jgi:nitrate reductase gamma subunit
MKIDLTSAILLIFFLVVMISSPVIARKAFGLTKGMSFVVGWGAGLTLVIGSVALVALVGHYTNKRK